MKNSDVWKHHSVTARTARVIRCDFVGKYLGLRFEPRLKVILLSCGVGVVSLIAGCVGTSGSSQDNAADSMQWTGLVAVQSVDECLAWDIACLLEKPVGAVPGASETGTGDSGTGGDGGTGDGGTGDGDGGRGDKGHGNGDENDDSADNGAGNTDPDNPGRGGG